MSFIHNFHYRNCFLLLILSISAYAQPTAILDSLYGTAQVQRAGSVKWIPLERDTKLYNNDVVKITSGSFGVIRWPDNSQAYAHGGTQILVNIGPQKNRKKILSYATVFVGSVFFVVKKMLPSSDKKDVQIYTPTSVISIRGTSFSVRVAPESGESTIKMINGTVRVQCIAKKAGTFLSAPFKTTIKKNTTHIKTAALLSTDIDSLKRWVPEPVLNLEVEKQLQKSKRDRIILSGIKNVKCMIYAFSNNSGYKGNWKINKIIPIILGQRMTAATNRLDIIYSDSLKKCLKNNAMEDDSTPVRFYLSGEISTFDIINHAEITVEADEYHERSIARVRIAFSLRDTHAEDDIFKATVTGERSGKKSVENSWHTIETYTCDLKNEQFSASILGSALDQALELATEKLIMKIYE